jgi:hypothetical protein
MERQLNLQQKSAPSCTRTHLLSECSLWKHGQVTRTLYSPSSLHNTTHKASSHRYGPFCARSYQVHCDRTTGLDSIARRGQGRPVEMLETLTVSMSICLAGRTSSFEQVWSPSRVNIQSGEYALTLCRSTPPILAAVYRLGIHGWNP